MFSACSAHSNSEPVTTTNPTGTGESVQTTIADNPAQTYPLKIDQAYADYAVSLPNVIYNTTGTQNGLIGNIYTFEGIVLEIDVFTEESGRFTYESAIVETQGGTVKVTNIFKSIYDASVKEFGTAITQAYYLDDASAYVLPAEGEQARFIATYAGYSNAQKMPSFYLGASSDLYAMIGEDDPVSKIKNESSEILPTTPEPATDPTVDNDYPTKPSVTEPHTTQPSITEPIETTPSETVPAITEPPQITDPAPTAREQSALRSAKNYLRVANFSYKGLIEQLEYEGYTTKEATYAADHCGANWNEQALKSAKAYLDLTAFSYKGLIDQLEFGGYTTAEATYGADHCGADWYEQAKRAAAEYLSLMSFSRSKLIDQLEFSGFTHDQAVYGAEANGL